MSFRPEDVSLERTPRGVRKADRLQSLVNSIAGLLASLGEERVEG